MSVSVSVVWCQRSATQSRLIINPQIHGEATLGWVASARAPSFFTPFLLTHPSSLLWIARLNCVSAQVSQPQRVAVTVDHIPR